TGDAAGDTYVSIENLIGSAFADILKGNGGANALSGGAGDDSLTGGAGAGVLDGGTGVNTASYSGSAAGVSVDLETGADAGGDAQGDTLSFIQNLVGSAFNDTLKGDDVFGNVLTGGAGADKLIGGSGVDTASYSSATAAVVANLSNAAVNTGDAAGDTYSSI